MKKKISKNIGISIGYSCYNESSYVIDNINKILKLLKKNKVKYEIIVIDDYSSEAKIKNLIKFCKKNKVRYIKHNENLGFFKSFKTGLINSKYEYFKLFAGDDATNINHINLILKKFHNQDVLIPYNYQSEVTGKPLLRKISSIIYTKIINLMSGLNLK